MAGNRPPSSSHSAFPGEAGCQEHSHHLITGDALWPSRTLLWPDLVALWPDGVSPPCKLIVLTVTSSCKFQDFLLQSRTQQFKAASLIASSALPEAAALATRSSNSVLAKTTLLGLDAIPTYPLSQWNPVIFSQMMNWKLETSLINFSLYIIKFAFYPLKRCPVLWGHRLTHCANGADLSLWLRWAKKRSNFSCMLVWMCSTHQL